MQTKRLMKHINDKLKKTDKKFTRSASSPRETDNKPKDDYDELIEEHETDGAWGD